MYKVIFVDDEFVIREKIKKLVNWQECGFELVGVFEDGKDAIDFLSGNKVDLIITDINMVFVSGIELAQYVYENKIDSIVVFLSAYDEVDYAKKGMKYGVKTYINKPIFTRELKQELKEIKIMFDEKYINQDVLNYYLYTDYFRGISMENNPNRHKLLTYLDFNNYEFCIFNLEIVEFMEQKNSDKLIKALYNIFILRNKNTNFCILEKKAQEYIVLIFSKDGIDDNWDKVFIKDAKDLIKLNILISNKNFFNNVQDISKFWSEQDVKDETEIVHPIIANSKRFIEDNLDKQITLNDIAEKIFVSPSYLSKFFKKATDENLGNYITERRIKKAKELLQNTNLTVYEVMEKVGYNNLPHFHSIFKKLTGVTPKQFRNRV